MIKILLAPFKTYYLRFQRSRIRQIMRGYRNLKKAGQLDCIAAVKQELTVHKLRIDGELFSARLFGAGLDSAELIVRQYLLVRIGGINLNRALLLAAGKVDARVVFSMPPEWGDIIEQHGFEVDRFRSAVLWAMYVTAILLYGCLKAGKIALMSLASSASPRRKLKPYVYFVDLVQSNLPQEAQGQQSHNIVSWYMQWDGRKSDIEAIHHSVPKAVCKRLGDIDLIEQPCPLPELVGISELTRYIGWAFNAVSIAAIDLLRGRWWHALLLNQAALAAQARIVPSNFLAEEYLFHNSGWIYRPLWTYEAEQHGCTVSLYFYSTNCDSFKSAEGYLPMPYGWRAMNWPRYIVWDEYQSDFVRRAVGVSANLCIVGSIWFQSSAPELQRLPSRSIAVFDVQPIRESVYRALGLSFEYYTPATAIQFLADIYLVLSEQGVVLALKRKRQIGGLAHPVYRHYMESLCHVPNYIGIDADLDATRLIENCIAVISMPYTSTAHLGRSAGKPSVYYDPHGLLQKNDRAAHGIDILQGQGELRRWLALVLENVPVTSKS